MLTLSSPELAFNARWLSEAEVAATFVAPHHFARVARRGHTLIVGPRGSGKTTLLKMLQPGALDAWHGPQAHEIRSLVDYCAAFVPADISWNEQVSSTFSLRDQDIAAVLQAAFTTSALRALVDTAEWRIKPNPRIERPQFLGIMLDRQKEVALVREVSAAWGIAPETPTLLGLRHALRRALLSLRVSVERASTQAAPGIPLVHPLVSVDLLQAAGLFVELFNDAVDERQRRWALLFDELEIAPTWVQKYLFAALRSADPNLLLKLALSPFNDNIDTTRAQAGPSAGQDYEQVALWFAQRDSVTRRHLQIPFCLAIWDTTLNRLGLPDTEAATALGESLTVEDDLPAVRNAPPRRGARMSVGVYGLSGKRGAAFKTLYEDDPTFRDYMNAHGVSPDGLNRLTENDKAQFVRKVAPIVAVREFYRRHSRDGGTGRSRKNVDLYTGAESFFTVSEGHPRWIKMVLARLLEDLPESKDLRIPRHQQGAALLAAAHRFNALLATLPGEIPSPTSKFKSVHHLVKVVAEFFHHQVVKNTFRAEPVLSFTVDARTPDGLLVALQTAVNIGAFVYMPDGEGEIILRSLRGKRFRVSHWLAPVYGLPLVSGRSTSLSTILFGTPQEQERPSLELDLGD